MKPNKHHNLRLNHSHNSKWPFPITFLTFIWIALLSITLNSCKQESNAPIATHIVLIGIDGMSIPGFQKAATPNMDELVRNGALSFRTRSVMPTISGPNWASHLLGAGPEQHGVTMNGWSTSNISITPSVTDKDGYFPSVFSVIREQMPDAKTAFFYDWDVLIDIFNRDKISKVEFSKHYDETFTKATPWIIEHRPLFTFLYIGYPDEVGHAHKWESVEYISELEKVDEALGSFFEALKMADMFDNTHFIIASDHGGIEYGHGGVSMEEIKVPWLISGPGIIKNRLIDQPNDVFNTAATILQMLGLQQPRAWVGRPLEFVFKKSSLSGLNNSIYVPQPFGNINSGLFTESQKLELSVTGGDYQLFYTLDGSLPGWNSQRYSEPLMLDRSQTIKALAMRGEDASMMLTIDFRLVKPIKDIKLQYQPDARYPANGANSLHDRQLAGKEFTDKKWLGFESLDLIADIQLKELSEVSSISLGYLHNPASWIFAPESVHLQISSDGKSFSSIPGLNQEKILQHNQNGRNEAIIRFPEPFAIRFIRLQAKNTGVCPPGHSGEGQPAWLFVDEVLIE